MDNAGGLNQAVGNGGADQGVGNGGAEQNAQNANAHEDNEIVEYSNNSAFECMVNKDTTVQITGFVSEINAAKDVGNKNQYRLFKFAVSNVGEPAKQIYCCVWGNELISKYEPEIMPNRIVRITGATSKSSKPNYTKVNEGFIPFELSIGSSTVITYHGFHAAIAPMVIEAVKVEFSTIAAQGHGTLVTMSGYLKMPFRVIQSRYGNMSYGNSAITNGSDKVNINITRYAPLDIPLGLWITVTGTLENDDNEGPTTIVCPDSASVVFDRAGRRLPAQDLMNGNRFPKRKAPTS